MTLANHDTSSTKRARSAASRGSASWPSARPRFPCGYGPISATLRISATWPPGSRSPSSWRRCPTSRSRSRSGPASTGSTCRPCPRIVPLVRMIDPGLTEIMVDYVTLAVLALHRDLVHLYRPAAPPGLAACRRSARQAERRVGILGLGELGRPAAIRLRSLGFPVFWLESFGARRSTGSRATRVLMACPNSCAQVDILVCLLPLTDDTRGILNAPRSSGSSRREPRS